MMELFLKVLSVIVIGSIVGVLFISTPLAFYYGEPEGNLVLIGAPVGILVYLGWITYRTYKS